MVVMNMLIVMMMMKHERDAGRGELLNTSVYH